VLADTRGDFAPEADPAFWLKQAVSVLNSGRPGAMPEPAKEATWYARFGG
jgi:hypothetical protein